MTSLVATADTFDSTQANFICLFVVAGSAAGISGLTAWVIYLARRGTPRHAQPVITAALFWAMITLGSIVYAALTQLAWQKQYLQNLMSGYGDPNDVAPGLHPALWGSLAAIYLLLLGLTMSKRK